MKLVGFFQCPMNVYKTKFVNFAYYSFDFDILIKFHSFYCNVNTVCNYQHIDKNYSFKYLGLALDQKLNCECYIYFYSTN